MTTPLSESRSGAAAEPDREAQPGPESALGPVGEAAPQPNGSALGAVASPTPALAPHTNGEAHTDAPAQHRTHGPGHVARHHPTDTTARHRARPRGKRRRLLLLFPVLLLALAVATILGYRYWYETTYFVSTDNASITGDLVQIGSLNAGRIVATRVDIGRPVRVGQEIAVVAMPQEVSTGAPGVGARMSISGTSDTLVSVYSPLNGIVAARMGYVGGTVAAGQPIYSLVDPSQVWVKANVEESSAWRVVVGQPVLVHVDALNQEFNGHVDAITPASAATFSLLPASNASGNFTKVTQYVPVKVLVDAPGVVLPLGTSVSVRIQVREPSSDLPLPWQP